MILPLTISFGWEWFDCVRSEERFKEIVVKIKEVYEKIAGLET